MIFQINGTLFELGEVGCNSFTQQIVLNERQEPLYLTKRMQVYVDQTYTGVQLNSRRFIALEQLCAAGVYSVGFNDPAGTPTGLWLNGYNSMSGIRVVNPPSWTPQTPVEMATHMTILMTFEADFEISGGSQIMAYEETLTFEDEGDQRIVPLETDTGPVEFFTTCLQPIRYLTQSGFAVGKDAYPLPNSPIVSLPVVSRKRDKKTPGRVGNRYMGYLVAWQYTFVVPSDGNWFPILR